MSGAKRSQTGRKLGRVDHPWRAVAFFGATIVAATGGFALGFFIRSPDAALLDARDQSIPVTALVSERAVDDTIRIQGEVVQAREIAISAQAPVGTSQAVVTSTAVTPGQALASGTLLATVSDRPIFALLSEIPLFRDLESGDEGSDVAAFQSSLDLPDTGIVDGATRDAVRAMYATAGIELPDGPEARPRILMAEYTSLDPRIGTPIVSDIAEVGTILNEDSPIATVRFGLPQVVVRASVGEVTRITPGNSVIIQGEGATTSTGTVSSVGDFQANLTPSGRPPGRDITIDLDPAADLPAGAAVSVVFGQTGEKTKAVPAVAVRSDSEGAYVLVAGKDEVAARLPVEELKSDNGWTAIFSPDLKIGDRVYVSG